MAQKIIIGPTDALIVIDIQDDFCPGGSLAVPDGDQIIPVVNALMPRFPISVLTQDWHPAGHKSFASAHEGGAPFGTAELAYGTQVLWPDHCVQGTPGAAFHGDLDVNAAQMIIRKGFRPRIDSYSAFRENDRVTVTGLAGYLRDRGVRRIFLTGLAYDFCVGYSAEDGVEAGFEVFVIEDACRGIDIDGSCAAMKAKLTALGVTHITSADLVFLIGG